MTVSVGAADQLTLPRSLGWTMAVAGGFAIYATYWDEAWHTDIGRDTAWAPPHLLLYGSVAVVGVGVGVWGLRALIGTRSLRAALTCPPLSAASLGAVGALAAAPVDAFWHEAYGRDAVLWSPPHMLVVLASTALVLGVLAGLPPGAGALRAALGVLLLANAATVVFEYEADVPQFSETLYLPILLVVGLPVVWLVRDMVPLRAPTVTVVSGYVALRLGVAAGLLVAGRSTPDLPLAVMGLAAYDLPLRRTTSRLAAAAAATAALAWSASALSLASPAPGAVAVTALPLVLGGLLVLTISLRRHPAMGATLLLAALALDVTVPETAEAHDPGQGETITSVQMRAVTTATGDIRITTASAAHCDDLVAEGIVARRAGETVRGRLDEASRCTFRGRLTLPDRGRWFLYAEFDHAGTSAEAWIPVEAMTSATLGGERPLYASAGTSGGISLSKVISGGLVYAGGLALLLNGLRAARSQRRKPGLHHRPV